MTVHGDWAVHLFRMSRVRHERASIDIGKESKEEEKEEIVPQVQPVYGNAAGSYYRPFARGRRAGALMRTRTRTPSSPKSESNIIGTHEAKRIFPNLPVSEAESYYRTRSRTSRATASTVALTRTRTPSGRSHPDRRPRQASGGVGHARSDQGGGVTGGVYYCLTREIERNNL